MMLGLRVATVCCLLGSCLSLLYGRQTSAFGAAGRPNSNVQVGYCTAREWQAAFHNCIFNFAVLHRKVLGVLTSNALDCRAEVFICPEVDAMMRCLNTQPVTTISNRCWINIKDVIPTILNHFIMPCSYDDLVNQCANKFTPLLPISHRRSTAPITRPNTNSYFVNPMDGFINFINSMITMNLLAGGGQAGLGKMFSGIFGKMFQ